MEGAHSENRGCQREGRVTGQEAGSKEQGQKLVAKKKGGKLVAEDMARDVWNKGVKNQRQ